MPSMNPAQFGHLANRLHDDGGFTVYAHTGEEPSSGWMVGRYSTEHVHEHGLPTADNIRAYASKHADKLSQPDHFLGGWGKYLDTPRRHKEEGPDNVGTAYVDMVAQRQKAMFGISEGVHGGQHMTPEERTIFKPSGGEVTNPARGYHDEPFESYSRRMRGYPTTWLPPRSQS